MSFKDRFPKPILWFLGISCEITDWLTVKFDFEGNRVYFTAKCYLSTSDVPVFIQNCQFNDTIVWVINPYDPYGMLTANDFSLSSPRGEQQISFSILLREIEPLLSIPEIPQ